MYYRYILVIPHTTIGHYFHWLSLVSFLVVYSYFLFVILFIFFPLIFRPFGNISLGPVPLPIVVGTLHMFLGFFPRIDFFVVLVYFHTIIVYYLTLTCSHFCPLGMFFCLHLTIVNFGRQPLLLVCSFVLFMFPYYTMRIICLILFWFCLLTYFFLAFCFVIYLVFSRVFLFVLLHFNFFVVVFSNLHYTIF